MSTNATESTELPNDESFGEKLQDLTTGCKIVIYALSSRRAMGDKAVGKVADIFKAEAKSIGGSRNVINRKHEYVKPVHKLLRKAKDFVSAYSVDYPEASVRLVKLDNVGWLREQVGLIEEDLNKALHTLDANWASVKADAKKRLGDLYSEADYPNKPSPHYRIELTFPAIKPDERLAKLHPELYEEQKRKIAERFEDAVKAAEATAAEELGKLLDHLVERLKPGEDGKAKTIRESTFENIKQFTERFKRISIGSNSDLEKLVEQVEALAGGVDVKELRKSGEEAKVGLLEGFAKLQEAASALVVDRPTRFIEELDDED